MIDDVEAKASEVSTLYLGYQLRANTRYNTDLIVDFENAGGRGISQALGLAGETNLDVVRNPTLSIAPYLSHGEIHQIIGLTNAMTDQDRGPFALATKVPVRRFEIRIGKMSLPDTLDMNSVGSDSHLQFTNWTIDNNGAWDYAADTRGYTVGGILEYDDRVWSARYAIAAMPTVANGIILDWAFSRANGQNWEFELRKGLFAPLLNSKREGAVRVLSFVNHAHMGDYRESVQQYLAGKIATPDITQTERNGQVKYGFGLNTEQEVTDSLRLFARFGWNEDQHESFAYTEVGQTILFGGDYNGHDWHQVERQGRRGVCLQRHQARPPELSSLRRTRFSAGRRKSELWAREYSRVVLQRPSVATGSTACSAGRRLRIPATTAIAVRCTCRPCACTSIFEREQGTSDRGTKGTRRRKAYFPAGCCPCGVRGQVDDHLAGLGVMQFFPRLALNFLGVRLQALDLLAHLLVFLLQVLDFLLQSAVFGAFLLPHGDAVLAVDHMPRDQQRQHHGHAGSRRPPQPLCPDQGTLAQRRRLGVCLGRFCLRVFLLRCFFRHRTQSSISREQIFRPPCAGLASGSRRAPRCTP